MGCVDEHLLECSTDVEKNSLQILEEYTPLTSEQMEWLAKKYGRTYPDPTDFSRRYLGKWLFNNTKDAEKPERIGRKHGNR